MSLADQAAAFKRRIAAQPVIARPQLTRPAESSSSAHAGPSTSTGSYTNTPIFAQPAAKKKKANNANVVYSQPADTGVGRVWQTRLITVLDLLKSHGSPIRLDDLAVTSGVDDLLTNPHLFEAFRKHVKVQYNEKSDTWQWKPEYPMNSSADLLNVLRTYSPRGGMAFATLKESWDAVGGAVEELERDGRVLVIRAGGNAEREGQIKMVFYNELQQAMPVDNDFKEMWRTLKTPDEVDVVRELQAEGLHTAAVASSGNQQAQPKKPKGRKAPNRRIKIQNTHLKDLGIDLSKPFVPPPK